jgi:hypothetical protein
VTDSRPRVLVCGLGSGAFLFSDTDEKREIFLTLPLLYLLCCNPRKTVIPPPTTRRGPDWEGERVQHLDQGGGRPAHLAHAPLARRVELPEAGGVPHNKRALCEGGEARALVRPDIGAESRLPGQLEKCPAHAPAEDLDSAPLGYTTAVPDGTSRAERSLRCLSHTVHRQEKRIAVHWRSPRIVVVTRPLFYEEGSNGSPQELHIRY